MYKVNKILLQKIKKTIEDNYEKFYKLREGLAEYQQLKTDPRTSTTDTKKPHQLSDAPMAIGASAQPAAVRKKLNIQRPAVQEEPSPIVASFQAATAALAAQQQEKPTSKEDTSKSDGGKKEGAHSTLPMVLPAKEIPAFTQLSQPITTAADDASKQRPTLATSVSITTSGTAPTEPQPGGGSMAKPDKYYQ